MRRARTTTTFAIVGTAIMIGMGTLLPRRAAAQASQSDDWQFQATIYGYLPSLGGSTKFPSPGGDINVSGNKIITNLKFAFMGALEVQKGSWGGFTDVMYLNVGGSKSGTRDLAIDGKPLPAGITADASLDIEGSVWTVAGKYRALSEPEGNVDVFAGARVIDVKENLRWTFSGNVGPFVGPGRQGSSEARLTNWDGIVGVKGRIGFGAKREWFIPLYVDAGVGDSQFTWQGIAGIGYKFGWGELIAAWRYLGYDFNSGKVIQNLNLNGPAIAVAFRW